MQLDITNTAPSEGRLPESDPYFFIYGPQSDIFTTLPPTVKFSCCFAKTGWLWRAERTEEVQGTRTFVTFAPAACVYKLC